MHSRIFQISKNPIKDMITEDRYYDNFVGNIADYVDTPQKRYRKGDIESFLKASLHDVAIFTDDNEKFTITNKTAYFEPLYNAWKMNLGLLQDITLNQFSDEDHKPTNEDPFSTLGMLHFRTESSYNDEYGVYVDDNDEYAGLQTLTSFMRHTKNGETYYIGSVIDYHC